jgi:hypothetical protein
MELGPGNCVYTIPAANTDMDHWRNKIFTLSFSGPVKEIRIDFAKFSAI